MDPKSRSVASVFHDTQGITTQGKAGWAYFSESKTKYIETNEKSPQLFLNAYMRGGNLAIMNNDEKYGAARDDVIFR